MGHRLCMTFLKMAIIHSGTFPRKCASIIPLHDIYKGLKEFIYWALVSRKVTATIYAINKYQLHK